MLKVRTATLRILGVAVVAGYFLGTSVTGIGAAKAANLVKNGSLENLKGKWINTRCNYMAVPAGSAAIANWTVPRTNAGELAWGRATCDHYAAAKGAFFVDLTGFGADATNGALQQRLTTSGGDRYKFSIDVCTCNDGGVTVMVGKKTLSLSPGRPLAVAGTPWEPLTGTFKGDPLHTKPALKIMNAKPGAQVVFIDNVVIKRQ
jgi:hypothetical protein